MEKKYFTFEGWDQHDTMVFGFTKCTLVASLGPYKAGDIVEYVGLDYAKGVIEVWATDAFNETPDWTGKLSLVVE